MWKILLTVRLSSRIISENMKINRYRTIQFAAIYTGVKLGLSLLEGT